MNRLTSLAVLLLSLTLAAGTAWGQTNYYSTGSVPIQSTANWKSNRDGTGSSPGNFTTPNQIFNVQSGHSMTAGGTWTVSGSGAKVVIETGGTITSGSYNHSLILDMQSNGTWIHTHTTYSNLTFGTLNLSSNFECQGTNPGFSGRTYGNFIYNSSTSVL